MSERVMLQGLLAEKRLKIKELVIKANALVANLHTQTFPFIALEDLSVDQISSQARDLEKTVRIILQIKNEIRKIEKELGIENDG